MDFQQIVDESAKATFEKIEKNREFAENNWATCKDGESMIEIVAKNPGSADSKERKRLLNCCLEIADNYFNNPLNEKRCHPIEEYRDWGFVHDMLKAYCSCDVPFEGHPVSKINTDKMPTVCEVIFRMATDTEQDVFDEAYFVVVPDFCFSKNSDNEYEYEDARLSWCADIIRKHYPEKPVTTE